MSDKTPETDNDHSPEKTESPTEPSEWERRFEKEINTFFDEAINRVPGFVDRNLKSFRNVMARSVGPRTGVGDIFVTMRNVVSKASESMGGPDFSTSSYTHDQLTEAFHREVVSPDELESLLERLFREFEEAQWERIKAKVEKQLDQESFDGDELRRNLLDKMEEEIAHDPLLAQTVRSGVKIGIPATLTYLLFGNPDLLTRIQSNMVFDRDDASLSSYKEMLGKLGQYKVPGWLGALGWAGGVVGSLAVGGLMEYALNSVRDIKGAYIRQLNSARHTLLYGEDPDKPEGRGLIHIVQGLEQQFRALENETARDPSLLTENSEKSA